MCIIRLHCVRSAFISMSCFLFIYWFDRGAGQAERFEVRDGAAGGGGGGASGAGGTAGL